MDVDTGWGKAGSMGSGATVACRKAIPCVLGACPPEERVGRKPEVVRDLGNGLIVGYAVETGKELEWVRPHQLAEALLSPAELHDLAVRNLETRARGAVKLQAYGPIHAVIMDGRCESSLLLLDSLWDRGLVRSVSNTFAVAVPSREILAFCDADSEKGVAELRKVVARVFRGGQHLVTDQLLRREGTRWVPLDTY